MGIPEGKKVDLRIMFISFYFDEELSKFFNTDTKAESNQRVFRNCKSGLFTVAYLEKL